MSWTGGEFTFPQKTSVNEMMAHIRDQLDENRGKMEPVHLPLKLHNILPFACYEDAKQYMADKGWDYDRDANHGVMYMEFDQPATNTKIKNLEQRIKEEEEKLENYKEFYSVRSFKAEYIGCKNCGSKLKRTLLKSDTCPLCHEDLRCDTTLKNIASYKGKIKKLKEQLAEEKKKVDKKRQKSGKITWLVYAQAYIG